MSNHHENIKRSIAKALTFRSVIIISDVIIVYTITQRYDLTLGVLVFSNLSSTTIYFIHERFWNSVQWGKVNNAKNASRRK